MGGFIAPPITHGQNIRMARLRRQWRVAKWAGVALCLLIAAVWGASTRWSVRWNWLGKAYHDPQGMYIRTPISTTQSSLRTVYEIQPALSVQLQPGCIFVARVRGPVDSRTGRWRRLGLSRHAWTWPRFTPDRHFQLVPLWAPFLLVALPTVVLFRRDRRHRIPSHCCQGCGYDLTGNVSGVCSECGGPA